MLKANYQGRSEPSGQSLLEENFKRARNSTGFSTGNGVYTDRDINRTVNSPVPAKNRFAVFPVMLQFWP